MTFIHLFNIKKWKDDSLVYGQMYINWDTRKVIFERRNITLIDSNSPHYQARQGLRDFAQRSEPG